MSRDQKEICLYCRWFRKWDGPYDLGECRVNAPIPDAEMEGKWPKVAAENWCGRFENRRDDHEAQQ